MAEGNELFEAIRAGDVQRARALLIAEPQAANTRNDQGISPLLYARYCARSDIVDLLLAAGAELDVFAAAALARAGLLAGMIERDLSLVAAWSPDGFSPLHLAAFFGDEETVRVLLKRGSDARPASRNAMKVTPLHSAAAAGHAGTVRALLDAGADPNARQQGGYTALHAAANLGNVEMIRMLLHAGADVNLANDEGKSAVAIAQAKGHPKAVEALTTHTA